MANTDKNIIITPNKGSESQDPNIVFSAANTSSGPSNITMTVQTIANGSLNFDASNGKLLAVNNDLSNTIYTQGTITANSLTSNLVTSSNVTIGNGSGGSLIGANLISANYFAGSGEYLSNITSANITGTVSTANTVTNNAQPNITSVGVLSSLSVSGNSNLSNLSANNGTLTGNLAVGNGTSGSITLNTVIANVVTGSLTTNAQPNITSIGSLSSLSVVGNITSGNLSTSGNVEASYFIGNGALLSGISVGSTSSISNGTSNVNIATSSGNVTTSVNGNANILVVTGTGVNVSGTLNTTGNTNLGNLEANEAVVTGNLTLGSGTGGSLSGGNLISANYFTGTLTTNAQPNITSLGILTSLSVSGNANVGNIDATNGVFNNVSGNGASLTSITGANVTGTVANATYATNAGTATTATSATTAGTVTTASQPNITSVGTLTSLSVSGNANVGNIGATNGVFTNVSGNGASLTSITGANVTGTVANATYATSAGSATTATSATSATTAGTVTTNAQPNITSVGTLTSLSVTGNVGAGNLQAQSLTYNNSIILETALAGRVITIYEEVGAGNATIEFGRYDGNASQPKIDFHSGTVVTDYDSRIQASGGNGTIGAGNLSLSAANTIISNNLSVGSNLSVTGNITGNFFIGNGSQLTGITAATATTAQTVTTNAQPNITSVGTLTSLSVSGNANIGNIGTVGLITATGNITSGNLISSTAIFRNGRNVPTYVAQSSAPSNPLLGDQWYDIDTGVLYQYQNDGSVSYWQDMSTNIGVLANLSVSGNANVGNLSATGNITVGNVIANSVNTNNTFGYKNRIINGGMRIDQRNNGGNVVVSSTVGVYTIDRFWAQASGATSHTVSRSTVAPTGFTNSLITTINTANTSPAAGFYATTTRQAIEGQNVADLAWGTASAKTITVSFWARSSVTGTYPFFIQNGAVSARSYVSSYTINAINTWEYKTIIIPGDTSGTWNTDNTVGLSVGFDLGSGSTYHAPAINTWYAATYLTTASLNRLVATAGANLYITGLQLEVGNMATSWDYRDIGREFIMCQRYYQQLQTGMGTGLGSTVIARLTWPYRVSMRASPSIGVVGTPQFFNGSVTITHSSVGVNYSTSESAQIDLTVTGGSATSGVACMQVNSSTNYYVADIEL